MLGNEFLFKKPGKGDFALIEVSLSYSTISRIVKRFVITALQDARSITGPRASRTSHFRLWLFIVLFMSFSTVYPSLAHLLNALLGGKGAPTPARPLLGTNYCRISRIIQKYWRIYQMVSCRFCQMVRQHCRIY